MQTIKPSEAIHSLRNNLAAIYCYAQLVQEGDAEAHKLLTDELETRLPEIMEELHALEDLEEQLRKE